jgi:hypothetical protein
MINPLVVVADDRFTKNIAEDAAPPGHKKNRMRKALAGASLLGFAVGAAVVASVLLTTTGAPATQVIVNQEVAARAGDAPDCTSIGKVQYGTYERKGGRRCDAEDALLNEHSPLRLCWHSFALFCKDKTCARCFVGSAVDPSTGEFCSFYVCVCVCVFTRSIQVRAFT